MDTPARQTALQQDDFGAVWPDSVVSSEFAMKNPEGTTPDDHPLVRRILDSYSRNRGDLPTEGTWHAIFMEKLTPIDEILRSQDIQGAAALLRDPASSRLFWGFDDLVKDYADDRAFPDHREATRVGCSRILLRLAEMLGSVRLFNPESSHLNMIPRVTPDQVLDAVEHLLGTPIRLPNIYSKEAGIATSRGVLSWRSLQSLYLIARVHTLLGGIKGKRLLEIGAGLGRTAYFGISAGARRYDIVDMPLTAASQGYFLGRTLGDSVVRLQGESMSGFGNARVHLLTANEFLGGNATYDIIVNVDSLTEIPRALSEQYVVRSMRSSRRFLSINHEVNSFTVRHLFEKSLGIAPLRYPNWTRSGYVEELFVRPKNFLKPIPNAAAGSRS